MQTIPEKAEVIRQLKKDILSLQRDGVDAGHPALNTGLGFLSTSFPNGVFPTAAVHELISGNAESAAATNGFLAGILCSLLSTDGLCLWIGSKRMLFPPALKLFNIDPERIVFIDTCREKETLWTVEEALKCKSVSAVVGELKEVSFTESRRLQLAVEQSRVIGFIHRYAPKMENITAFVSRWRISPLASELGTGVPGIGFPRWYVQLTKARNGRPAAWQIEWADGFRLVPRFTRAVSHAGFVKTG